MKSTYTNNTVGLVFKEVPGNYIPQSFHGNNIDDTISKINSIDYQKFSYNDNEERQKQTNKKNRDLMPDNPWDPRRRMKPVPMPLPYPYPDIRDNTRPRNNFCPNCGRCLHCRRGRCC